MGMLVYAVRDIQLALMGSREVADSVSAKHTGLHNASASIVATK